MDLGFRTMVHSGVDTPVQLFPRKLNSLFSLSVTGPHSSKILAACDDFRLEIEACFIKNLCFLQQISRKFSSGARRYSIIGRIHSRHVRADECMSHPGKGGLKSGSCAFFPHFIYCTASENTLVTNPVLLTAVVNFTFPELITFLANVVFSKGREAFFPRILRMRPFTYRYFG